MARSLESDSWITRPLNTIAALRSKRKSHEVRRCDYGTESDTPAGRVVPRVDGRRPSGDVAGRPKQPSRTSSSALRGPRPTQIARASASSGPSRSARSGQQRGRQLAMEMNDAALEAAESKNVVGAAADALLN